MFIITYSGMMGKTEPPQPPCRKLRRKNLRSVSSVDTTQNKSECVPVLVNSSVSKLSFCSQTSSQSPFMWHSQLPA